MYNLLTHSKQTKHLVNLLPTSIVCIIILCFYVLMRFIESSNFSELSLHIMNYFIFSVIAILVIGFVIEILVRLTFHLVKLFLFMISTTITLVFLVFLMIYLL